MGHASTFALAPNYHPRTLPPPSPSTTTLTLNPPRAQVDFWRDASPAVHDNGTAYGTYQYTEEARRIILAHDKVSSHLIG